MAGSSMRSFAVTNLKGGVGKTTTTLALGGLLQARGFKVLLLDLDPQASLTSAVGLSAESSLPGVHSVFAGQAELGNCISHTMGLDVVGTAAALARAERMPERPDGLGGVLSAALKTIAHRYHYVLIDCPPSLGVLLINALAAADRLIVPVQCSHLALIGIERMDATLKMIARSRNGRAPPRIIVPTMVDLRTRAAHAALARLRAQWPTELWRSLVPEDTSLRDAARFGRLPHQHAPRSRAMLAYAQLLADVLGETGAYSAAVSTSASSNGIPLNATPLAGLMGSVTELPRTIPFAR